MEIALRIGGYNPALTPGVCVSHPSRRYTFKPNAVGKTYGKFFRINSLGVRDYEYSRRKGAGTFRILAVGDSCTFGIGLNLEDTYPKQIEKALRGKFPSVNIEVINCGISSYNTVYEYLFLKDELIKFCPDLVIIGYVYNDSVHNYPLTPARSVIINKIKDALRTLYAYEFIVDRAYKLNYIFKGLAARDPTLRRENLNFVYSDRYIGWRENKQAFRDLAEFSRENGVSVVYLIYPKLEMLEAVYPYRFYHAAVKAALGGQPYVLDLLPFLEGQKTQELWVTRDDSHPNQRANAIIAGAVCEYLVSRKLIKADKG